MGLSSGQRKKVSIAVEIIADPAVLFLDVKCIYIL